MTGLGIITNVRAGRNRRRLAQLRARVRAAGALGREVDDLASIRAAAREFAALGVEVLAVNGGDGTASAVLTELLAAGQPLPALAIVPGGTTNMSANDLNAARSLDAALASLSAQAGTSTARRVQRRVLEVRLPQAGVRYGFFLGAGAVIEGMKHFHAHVGARGLRGELAAGISLLRGVLRMAAGRGPRCDAEEVAVRLAGGSGWREHQSLLIGTTLERLLLGIRPWWGAPAGPIRVTTLSRRPGALLRTAPALLRGRPSPRLAPEHGYFSDCPERFELRAGGGFSLDGELHFPAPGEVATVAATAAIEFLSL